MGNSGLVTEPVAVDRERRFRCARIGHPAADPSGLDVVHNRQESRKARHILFSGTAAWDLCHALCERGLKAIENGFWIAFRGRVNRQLCQYPIYLSAGTIERISNLRDGCTFGAKRLRSAT